MRLSGVLLAALTAVAVLSGAASAWLTNTVKGAQLGAARAELARAEQRYTAQQLAQAEAASMAMYQAQRRGDALTRDLEGARRAANQLKQERDDALSRVTDGRDCLREPALRVLDGAPGIGLRLPGPAGGVADADAGYVATDTDLARWALDAGSQYAECARRLDALIEWHETAPTLAADAAALPPEGAAAGLGAALRPAGRASASAAGNKAVP